MSSNTVSATFLIGNLTIEKIKTIGLQRICLDCKSEFYPKIMCNLTHMYAVVT